MDKLCINGYIGERDESLDRMLADSGIGENFTAQMMRDYLSQNAGETEIEIEVNSVGGDVVEGFEIYDLLQAEKKAGKKITTYGKAFDSIASIIFLAGDERKVYSGAKPLIHNSWLSAEDLGDLQLNKETLRQIADGNEEADFQILGEYLKVTGRDKMREIQDLMRNEAQLTDEQLIALNFATEILPSASKAKQAKAFAFNSRLLNLGTKQDYADIIGFKDGKVLLIQRSETDDFEPSKYAFPGGKIEEGESAELTAARECKEETGYIAENLQPVNVVDNGDGTKTHYFTANLTGSEALSEREIQSAVLADPNEIDQYDILLGQVDRYKDLIINSIQMAENSPNNEKLNSLEKGLNKLFAFLKGAQKNMVVSVDGGETQLYIFSEDGEVEGKKAVVAEDGEPTETPAPAGQHTLSDGRTITVGEGGIIQSVAEAQAMYGEDEMKAAVAAKEEEMKAIVEEKEKALQAFKAETQKKETEFADMLKALKSEVAELKEVVPGDNGQKADKLKAFKEMKEQKEKMTPSQRRVLALKNSLIKNQN